MDLQLTESKPKTLDSYFNNHNDVALVPTGLVRPYVHYTHAVGIVGSCGSKYHKSGLLIVEELSANYKPSRDGIKTSLNIMLGKTNSYYPISADKKSNQTKLRKIVTLTDRLKASKFIIGFLRELRFKKKYLEGFEDF